MVGNKDSEKSRANLWEINGSIDKDSQQLRPGIDITDIPLRRLRRAFEKMSALFEDQTNWFRENAPSIQHAQNHNGAEHRFTLDLDPPVDNWAFDASEIIHQLSNAKDNLFKDIVRRSMADSDEYDSKRLRNAYWPSCFEESDWTAVTKKYSFIPNYMLDRIEAFQPFRDRREGGAVADMEWKKLGSSTWARQLNNQDKHDKPIEVALNYYLGDRVLIDQDLHGIEYSQRWDTTEPHDPEPLITLYTKPMQDLSVTIPSLDLILLAKNTAGYGWLALNYGVWNALIENHLILNTVYYGKDRAHATQITWGIKSPNNLADFRYELRSDGSYSLVGESNPAQVALEQGYV